ncbi:Beta carbonic anhydrase 5, chloroplastic [Ancistrocladus abbreviatus]
MASLQSSSLDFPRRSIICDSTSKFRENEHTYMRLSTSFKVNTPLRLKASKGHQGLTEEVVNKEGSKDKLGNGCDLFDDMRQGFFTFKRDMYVKNLEHFQNLAESQRPKFMVIACADSRVCPSTILGFKPGEAFTIRNVANLVPPFEKGPSETNAALEFAVNSLEVENILVVGHSRCGGIHALMSMPDEVDSRSFIGSWVVVGKDARMKSRAAASSLSFEQQCQHCEKESVNCSLLNLLTYPWIEDKVTKGLLSLHGGYYDFIDCTFEKWTLDCEENSLKVGGNRYSIKNREHWS